MIYLSDADFTLYNCDVLEGLAQLEDESVHCVVTSPPYWGLRDYGTGTWEGGHAECDHDQRRRERDPDLKQATSGGSSRDGLAGREECRKCGARRIDNQLGLEPTPEAYIERMVEVFREVRRVLRKDGTCWLNIGDSYASGTGSGRQGESGQRADRTFTAEGIGKPVPPGLKPKDLCMIPARLALALQADGWVVRSEIVWTKSNPMPESVTDRPTSAHEKVWLLTKAKWTGIPNPLRLSPQDATWLAAMIDAEGSICVNTKKGRDGEQTTYSAALRCYNASRAIIEKVAALTGVGTISTTPGSGENGTRVVYRWQCGGKTAVPILDAIEPFLIAKQEQAHLLLELQGMARHHGAQAGFGKGMKRRPAALTARQEEIARGCSELNKTGETDVRIVPWKRGRWIPYPYAYDQEAVREPVSLFSTFRDSERTTPYGEISGKAAGLGNGSRGDASGRNLRNVWEIPTEPYPDAHFATYPAELVRRCIAAGTSERGCCPECGAPWVREVEKGEPVLNAWSANGAAQYDDAVGGMVSRSLEEGSTLKHVVPVKTTGWRASCECGHAETVPALVADIFMGSGTTALVARKLGRRCVGIELNPDYCELIAKRTAQLSLLGDDLSATKGTAVSS